jgi:hypothetical protein
LCAGIPLGVAAGRLAWSAFADLLGTSGGPRVPVLLIAAVAAGLLVVANLLGELPARSAARQGSALLQRD